MIRKMKNPMLALTLALALSACDNPRKATGDHSEAASFDQPDIVQNSVKPSDARSEAATLADRLSADNLDRGTATATLSELSDLVNENIDDFPDDMRNALTGDIQSAQDALQAGDMHGVKEAAIQMQRKLSGSTSASAGAN